MTKRFLNKQSVTNWNDKITVIQKEDDRTTEESLFYLKPTFCKQYEILRFSMLTLNDIKNFRQVWNDNELIANFLFT